MADPFIAEIRMFTFNFAPRGWAWCDGQLLPLSQNTALFSLLGTTYGGNGKSNFALPDLQGRTPIFNGQGPGLSLRDLGETGGAETVTLLESEIPSHSHALRNTNEPAEVNNPLNATMTAASAAIYSSAAGNTNMNAATLGVVGGDLPHNNMMPYLALYFCIAMQGVFPPRS
jgi:microcystin-dependent protein